MPATIVATTDFSARADRAVDRAIMLGRQLGGTVVLVHAVDYPEEGEIDRVGLDSKMRAVLPEDAGEVTFAYPQGSAPRAIVACAQEQGADVILMGVARHNSIGDFVLGTSVDHVIRSSSKPVLVVKNRPRKPYANVLVAMDFSEFSLKALDWVAEFLPDARLHLVHAFHAPFEAWNKAPYVTEEIKASANARFDELLQSLDASVRARVTTHIYKDALSRAVDKVVDHAAIDLIVLGSHGESGFRHATFGSQANALLQTTSVDTTIVSPRTGG